jgi:zinc protease
MIVYDRPDDYVRTLKAKIEAQTDDAVRAAARAALQPGQLTWVIVGDLKKIEQPIRDLKLGEVTVLDREGQAIR